jgi:hypothetical protein
MYNNTALATSIENKFILPMAIESEFSSEDIAEDSAGMQLNFFRVKVPSGGGLSFEIPTADSNRPEITQSLQGIILYHHPANSYWPGGNDEENVPPVCSSTDGVKGAGSPGTQCKDCQHNQWGTGKDGFGKACKNGFTLYLLRSGEYLPLQVSLPPTSIKPFAEFVTAFSSRGRGVCGSIIEIGLKKAKSPNNGKEYSVATFNLLEDITGTELRGVIEYSKSMKAQIKHMYDQRSYQAMERQYSGAGEYANGAMYDIPPYDGYSALDAPPDDEDPMF